MNRLRICILFITPLLIVSLREKQTHLKLTKGYDHKNDKYVRIDKFELTPINRHNSFINIEAVLKRKLKSVWCHGQLFKQDSTTAYKPWLINITMDICGFLSKSYFNFYGTIILKEFERSTNLPVSEGCPVSPLYFRAQNFTIRTGALKKLPLETAEYRLIFDYFEKKRNRMELVFGMDLYFKVYQTFVNLSPLQ